MARGPETGACG